MKRNASARKQKQNLLSPSLFGKALCLILALVLLVGCSANENTTEEKAESNATTKGEESNMKEFGNIKVGSTLSFGSYEQDGNTQTKKEELSWLVLAVENNKALVITTEGIDCQLYNVEAIETDWEQCSLRKWLNEKFFQEIFTPEEADQIAATEISWEDNPTYPGNPGKASRDKLFLLSISEAEAYFSSDEQRLCKPTPLAIQHAVYADESTGACAWWLRNQGSQAECAALVNEFGAVDHSGDGVYCEGTAVRPAMWILLP